MTGVLPLQLGTRAQASHPDPKLLVAEGYDRIGERCAEEVGRSRGADLSA